MNIRILPSAHKHGYSDDEIMVMMGRAFKRLTDSQNKDKHLLYCFDNNANLVEIGYEANGQTAMVFHCMRFHNTRRVQR
jgi:hypothetical protein